jgi:histidinol dehydrogenase
MTIAACSDWMKGAEAASAGPAGRGRGLAGRWAAYRAERRAGAVDRAVAGIIAAVKRDGDSAIRRYAARFDKTSPERLEVPAEAVAAALADLRRRDADLAAALAYAAANIERFARAQRGQFADFELELGPGLVAAQRVIPVARAAVYVPAGRFPLFSSVLMGAVPAKAAGVREVVLASPPLADGLPDPTILAAAALAGVDRVFAVGGAQAIAGLAFGTASLPRADVVVGPGNKYVAAAKRQLFGQVGVDLVAGPTDVLVLADAAADPDLIAADLLAQAEHDPDAAARALLPSRALAEAVAAAVERRLAGLATAAVARASWERRGLLLVYADAAEADAAADAIAPEHLELHVADPAAWAPRLSNYGSLFSGARAAEVLGDYSAGVNHTLPTGGSARFTGGLSVRHFLKTVTGLSCPEGPADGYDRARAAAERIARAEGLAGHAASAAARLQNLG